PHRTTSASEQNQRDPREGKLHAENDLAEQKQFRGPARSEKPCGNDRWNNGDQSRDQPSQPWTQTNVEKTFHHDLAGERAGQGGILARSEQGKGEQRARDRNSQHWRHYLLCVLNFCDAVLASGVKGRRRNNKDGGVNEKRE